MIVLMMIQDIIIQRYHRWPGMYPIPQTNQEEEYMAKSN
jgi:hypothetical protein